MDPTLPQFSNTKGMNEFLSEKRARKKRKVSEQKEAREKKAEQQAQAKAEAAKALGGVTLFKKRKQ